MKKLLLILTLIFLVNIANAQLAIGDQLPDITLKNQLQVDVSLTDFKGKVLLVDIWASWCAPCRVANKKLVKLYQQADKRNFHIVGIALDKDKSKWLSAIKKDHLQYTQLIDSKGFDAKTALLFGVEQLPTTFLFDVSGKLIAINPSEEQIIIAIKNLSK